MTPSPVTQGPLFDKWGNCVPWFKGEPSCPTGRYCMLCVYAFKVSGLGKTYGSLQAYTDHCLKHPEKNTSEDGLLPAKRRYIDLYNEDPIRRITSALVGPITTLIEEHAEEDALVAPQKEFVELKTWKEENKCKDIPACKQHCII